jgi:hypothetical protein
METMANDKQFLYISSAQFHQTGLAHVLIDQTIFSKIFLIKAIFEKRAVSRTDLVISFTPFVICGRKQRNKKVNEKSRQQPFQFLFP